jgi:Major Facilitator Superfamily
MVKTESLQGRGVFAACLLAAAGALVFNSFPLWLSSIADQFAMNDEQLGLIGTSFLGGFALVALFGFYWMRFNWRSLAIVGYVLAGIGFLSLLAVDSVAAVNSVMALAGAGCGVIFTIGTTLAGYAPDPDRAFGFKVSAEMVLAGLVMFVMTAFVISAFGFTGFVVGAVLLVALTALAIPFVPANLLGDEPPAAESVSGSHPGSSNRVAAWLAVAGLFIQFGCYAGLWGFMERIGQNNGVESGAIGTILSIALLVGLGTALLAATLGDRYGTIKMTVLALILSIVCGLVLLAGKGVVPFTLGACGILGLFQFFTVYQMGLVVSYDVSGKLTVLIAFILSAAGAVGPGIVGAIVEGPGFGAAYGLFIGVAVLTATLNLVAGKMNVLAGGQLDLAEEIE